jgi:peptidoglycan hydrolase CwlO-like protein
MRKGAAASLAAVLALLAPAATAQTIDDRLEDARAAEADALAEADAVSADLAMLSKRYDRIKARADAAAARVIDAYLQETTLQAEMAQAQDLLNGRADAVYRAGPAAFLEVMFDSSTLGEFVARGELVEHALLADVAQTEVLTEAQGDMGALRRELDESRAELAAHRRQLEELRTVMELRLAEAQESASRAGVRVQSLIEEQRELAQAAVSEAGFADLVAVTGELRELLEMLGPTGGRGCAIPEALAPTGKRFAGEASFYGEEFAGNPTAIGHPFNPALFTAAHRTLPLPSFLHVKFGGRCATVVVNDRGPYVEGRILDLSEGAAKYLGLPGVGQVECEVLAPK